MNRLTLGEVARAIGAQLDGEAERVVAGMAPLAQAGPDQLCFAESAEVGDTVQASSAGGVIVGEDFPALPGHNLLRLARPRVGFIQALELFAPNRRQPGVHPSAVVADGVAVGDDVGIGPNAVIEANARIGNGTQIRAGAFIGRDVQIGEDCDIGPNSALMDGTRIGARCILHAGVVLGADGYGYQWLGDHHHKIPQIGIVVLGDDIEIGANSCVDRATLGETRIGSGSKFDNLVHVAHNNVVGEHVLLTAQVGIAGSSRLGNGVVMGGQSGISDHVNVGDGVQIGGQSGVFDDLADGEKAWGTPAHGMTRVMREHVLIGKLPETAKRLRRQEKELEVLRDRIADLEARLAE